MSNAKLKKFFDDIDSDIDSAKYQDDLISIIQKVKQCDMPLRYDYTLPYFVLGLLLTSATVLLSLKYYFYQNINTNGILLLIAIFAIVFINLIVAVLVRKKNIAFICGMGLFWLFSQSFEGIQTHMIVLTVIFAISCTCVIVFIVNRKNTLKNLATEIFEKDTLFDNALKPVPFDPTEKAEQLGKCFHEFKRGNYSREIKSLNSGSYSGNEHMFDFHCYNFHYVDRTKSSDNHAKYNHYHRYGIYLSFKFVSNLAILNQPISTINGEKFRSASNKFNKLFSVKAETEIIAAKFLKPAIVIAIEEITQEFSELNFEFNSDAQLCMSFSNKDLLLSSNKRQYGLDDPDNFINEIKMSQKIPKLEKALEHIHTLMKYSDNNFLENNS